MHDTAGPFSRSQDEIIVLRAIKTIAEPSNLIEQRLPNNCQMADVVVTSQSVRAEIRFEMWVTTCFSIFAEFVFVRIEHFNIRLMIYCVDD